MTIILEALLRSHNLRLAKVATDERQSGIRNEVLWDDPIGSMRISRGLVDGASYYRLAQGDEIAVSFFPDGRLVVSPAPSIPQSTIDHFLTDQIFPRVLSERYELVLHAGAVSDQKSALLMLGRSGSGKSTLATSFKQSGWALMGDDAVVMSDEQGVPMALAMYPSLRLFPDSIDALFPTAVASHDMAHYSSKRRLDVTGAQEAGPMPVEAMFVLGDDGRINVQRLSTAQACMAIVENSFALDPTDREKARCRLARASELGRAIPAYSVSYPREFRRLPEVREAILTAVADVRDLLN